MLKVAAILEFKFDAQDGFVKNGTNLEIVAEGIKIPKIIGSTNVAKNAPILHFTIYYIVHSLKMTI